MGRICLRFCSNKEKSNYYFLKSTYNFLETFAAYYFFPNLSHGKNYQNNV